MFRSCSLTPRKRIPVPFLLAFLLAIPAAAQITILPSDGARAGDSIYTYFIPDTLLQYASIGDSAPGQTWNLNQPMWNSGFGRRGLAVVKPEATIFDTAYPGATLVFFESEENATTGSKFFTYDYFRRDDSGVVDMGGGNFFHPPMSDVKGRDFLLIEKINGFRFPLPLVYGARWSNQIRSVLLQTPIDTSLPPDPRLASIGTGSETAHCDAWGTIVTPYGSYQALRVHSFLAVIDSVLNSSGEYDVTVYDTLETYNWYIKPLGVMIPVASLEIYQGEVVSVQMVRYVNKQLPGEVSAGSASEHLSGDVVPNPATSYITIPLKSKNNGRVMVSICTPLGNEVLRREIEVYNESVRVDVSSISSGSYVCLVRTGDDVVSRMVRILR